VITPSLVIYEVYEKVKKEKGEELALSVVAQMAETKVLNLKRITNKAYF